MRRGHAIPALSCLVCLALYLAATGQAEDAGRLSELNADEAKRLAEDKPGKLLLDELKALSPEVATELARHRGWLSLNGLTALSDEAAAILGHHQGALHLDGLTNISAATAAALAAHRGELSLNGLTAISDEAAEGLARHTGGRLFLKRLTTLSPKAARALSQRKGGGPIYQLHLDGLTALSPGAAAALAEMTGHNWNASLPNIETVTDEVARALAKREGRLSMPGLTELSDEAARLLLPKTGGNLPALKTFSPAAADALARTRGDLVLNSLTDLTDEATAALGENNQNRGNLYLNGLTALTPEAARAICRREGDLFLNGLSTVSIEVLEALAEHKSPGYARPVVHLDGLTALSNEGAAVLGSWEKWSGDLPALKPLSEPAAVALASSRRFKGSLPALKTLSPEVARALTQKKGNLSLDGLTTISDEVAAALAGRRGGTLALNGVTSLSDNAAAALARHNGRLSLGGLHALTDRAAEALAGYRGDWLFLDGLTTLSVESARSLARREGVLSVKGLQTVSEEALAALRENSLVVLPDLLRSRVIAVAPPSANTAAVHEFLNWHCADCHADGSDKGDFELEILERDDLAGRVGHASILERLRAGDMPPAKKPRPEPEAAAAVMKWIEAKLDSPLAGPVAPYPVADKPIDGNRLPHAILFGGPREPGIPPPPRLWRLSPEAYDQWVREFDMHGLQKPFGVIPDPGFKDYAALYLPDEGASGLLLSNAERIVAAQTRSHRLVNVVEEPEAAKHRTWPDEARAMTATPEEREHLAEGVRVSNGNGVFAPLMHPKVRANREESERALRDQFNTALARPPSEAELEGLLALYNKVADDGDMRLAGETVLIAPLLLPEAILRFEAGQGAEVRPGVRMLSPRETAMALSLALSQQREPGLLAAAAEGKLTSREEVAEAVRRILDDPGIEKSRVVWFFREFFDYYRAPEVFKDPLPDYKARRGVHYNPRGYVSDTDVLVLRVLSRDRDVLEELLTTTESFRTHELFVPNGTLDDLRYADSPLFRPFSRLALDHRREPRGDRIGLLMQPSWHVAWSTNFHNDIVRRGRWVRERLLGGRVPDLPVDAAAMVPDDPHRTLRERQMVTREAKCWKCHQKMDDLGLPFEGRDHYGFPRDAEEASDLGSVKVFMASSRSSVSGFRAWRGRFESSFRKPSIMPWRGRTGRDPL